MKVLSLKVLSLKVLPLKVLLVSAILALSAGAGAVPITLGFSQAGFDIGGRISGQFRGEDLDANGQLDYFAGEISAFNIAYTDAGGALQFSLGLADLSGLVFDLEGPFGVLGDGLGDTATMTLEFADGSLGTVHYFANGHRRVAKERLEVFRGYLRRGKLSCIVPVNRLCFRAVSVNHDPKNKHFFSHLRLPSLMLKVPWKSRRSPSNLSLNPGPASDRIPVAPPAVSTRS